MTSPGSRIRRALGGPAARRRRHRRAVLLGVVLLLVAGALVVAGGGDDDDGGGDADEVTTGQTFTSAAEACTAFEARLLRELELSFPQGAPTPDAEGEYLSRAFADTTQELVDVLRDLDPPDAADAVDALQALVDQLREDPSVGIGTNPFAAEVAPAFDDAGLPECGSEFLGAPG